VNSFEKDPLRNLPLVTPPQTGERRAAWWQITAAAIGAVAIVFVFLWGISNQRDENTGQPTAATQATPSPKGEAQAPAQQNIQQSGQQQQGSSNAPTTTGQGSREQGEAEQKTNSGQPSNQQPTNAGQNAPPTENSGQQAPPRQR
jgi:hypothetical protein